MNEEVPKGYSKGQFYANLYRSYLRRNRPTIWREEENWRMYSGVNKGQWDPAQLQMLIEEKRAPHQVNFTYQEVNKLLGNLLQNELDTEFIPSRGGMNDASLALNEMYLTDKDLGTWSKTKRMITRAGLVMRGTVEFFVDYTNDEQGRANYRFVNHNRVMFDPDWTSDNINDNKHIIQWAWMDPEEISFVWNKKSADIDSAIELWRQQVPNRMDDANMDASLLYGDTPEFVDILNGRFLVIQTRRLDRITVDQLYDMNKKDFLPVMSKENMDAMMRLKGSSLKVLQNKVAIEKIVTIVPGLNLDLILEDSNSPIQMGRYSMLTWSYSNVNGVPIGAVDFLKDLQQIYNKRESAFTHWQTTATNGAEFVEEDFFADPKEYNKYVNEKNIPGGTFKVQAGKLTQGRMGIASRPRDNIPNDLHESADRAYNMVPSVIPGGNALSGGEGKSGESSKLFNSKKLQALATIEPTIQSLEEFEKEFGECYFALAKQIYSGAPREVFNKRTKESIYLNMPTESGVINDMSTLKRHNIVVSKSKRGVTVREELLNRYTEMMPFFQNPILRSQVEKAAITVLPNIPEKEIEAALVAADEFMDLQISRVRVEKMQNNLGIATASQQMQQFSQQQSPQIPMANPQKTPAGGGGVSVEGKTMKPGESVPVDVMRVNQMSS